jgi:RNA polymerase sigma-70 factor, ECF subfamily
MTTNAPDDGLSVFISMRPRLYGIAYRTLGSAVEAEDGRAGRVDALADN